MTDPVAVTRAVPALVLALLLGACGGGDAVVPAAPDPIERATRAGLDAFARGRHDVAGRQFRRALTLAHAADDPRRVMDARFNLAANLAEQAVHGEAIEQLDALLAESAREALPVGAEVWLLRAAIERQRSDATAARDAAVRALAAAGADDAVRARSRFLLGLLAADGGDRAGVLAALTALDPAPADPRLRADRVELDGRLAALDGDAARAVALLDSASTLRGSAGDLRGAARVRAAAAAVASAAGLDAEAARNYLRAGRSAAARGDGPRARRWLDEARRAARAVGDGPTEREAAQALDALEG